MTDPTARGPEAAVHDNPDLVTLQWIVDAAREEGRNIRIDQT